MAASIISSTPEFNLTRSLVGVSDTKRVSDSTGDQGYAEFTFTEHGSATQVKAHAEFGYWADSWHLRNFAYGHPPRNEIIRIKSDVSPEDVLSK